MIFFERPISAILLVAVLIALFLPLVKALRKRRC
jgi:TctA family transporter